MDCRRIDTTQKKTATAKHSWSFVCYWCYYFCSISIIFVQMILLLSLSLSLSLPARYSSVHMKLQLCSRVTNSDSITIANFLWDCEFITICRSIWPIYLHIFSFKAIKAYCLWKSRIEKNQRFRFWLKLSNHKPRPVFINYYHSNILSSFYISFLIRCCNSLTSTSYKHMKWSRCAPKSYTKWNCNELKPNRCGASPLKPNWLKVPIARMNYAAMWAVLKIKVLRCRMVSAPDILSIYPILLSTIHNLFRTHSQPPIPHSVISWFALYALFSSSSTVV